MRTKHILISMACCLLLNACVGLTFDDIFNPSLESKKNTEHELRPIPAPVMTHDELVSQKRKGKPYSTVHSSKSAKNAAECITTQIQKSFNLPSNFYTTKKSGDNYTVQLVNPHTKKGGLFIDAVAKSQGSDLNLYSNGTTMSAAWKSLPEKCK